MANGNWEVGNFSSRLACQGRVDLLALFCSSFFFCSLSLSVSSSLYRLLFLFFFWPRGPWWVGVSLAKEEKRKEKSQSCRACSAVFALWNVVHPAALCVSVSRPLDPVKYFCTLYCTMPPTRYLIRRTTVCFHMRVGCRD